MKACKYLLGFIAAACVTVSLFPPGNVYLWAFGGICLLASIGCSVAAENHDIKYGKKL